MPPVVLASQAASFQEAFSKSKIWRYMDVAKFVSLLTTRSLYFACPTTQFQDPFEGWLPKSHIEALSNTLQNHLGNPLVALRKEFVSRGIPLDTFDRVRSTLADQLRNASTKATARFGVSCWHESEYESDAMWKLYSASGRGIAIESTVGQLMASVESRKGVIVDRVRYIDFDQDPVEKGHKHYGLFIKRKSFEHEKEVRATILLQQEGQGASVPCDLDVLVSRIHVSPLTDCVFNSELEALCSEYHLDKSIRRSSLYSVPNYGITI